MIPARMRVGIPSEVFRHHRRSQLRFFTRGGGRKPGLTGRQATGMPDKRSVPWIEVLNFRTRKSEG